MDLANIAVYALMALIVVAVAAIVWVLKRERRRDRGRDQ
jgi:hypothetical protein